MPETEFDYHFTLSEAVKMLPKVKALLAEAEKDLEPLRDDIILYRRLYESKRETPMRSTEPEVEVLEAKWDAFEALATVWLKRFAEEHILLRNLERGLVDFPYQSSDGEEFLLCWQLSDDDGIFYFHESSDGFRGRQPITLLPD